MLEYKEAPIETLTNTELAILGLVAERPKHGYQIEQDIAARGMREWTEIGFSSIYYVLNKLEAAGWLSSESETPTEQPAPAGSPAPDHRAGAAARSGPARKVYHLTEAGWAGYQAGVRERLAHPRLHTGDFDLALANLPAIPPEEARAALETHLATLRDRLANVQAKWAQDHASVEQAGIPFPPHVDALFDYSVSRLEAEIAWVEKYFGSQIFS